LLQDVTTQVHIKCAVCADFELCVDCMSAGATVHPHHPEHSYRVMDSLAFQLFSADWSAAEELLLLEAIEINGLGNWSEVRAAHNE
jgi:transcriptional adapter 2-alpha